jgi:monoamine oxidase
MATAGASIMERAAEVIVVGAGMAGLKAARELADLGCGVIVVEADDRVGGRLKASRVAGAVADVGGQWVGARHHTLLAEAARLGIATYPQYAEGKVMLQLTGKMVASRGDVPAMPPLALVELARLQRLWRRDMLTVPAEAPWTAPKAAEWDGMTLESWIRRHLRTASARAFARLVSRGAWAMEAGQASYLWFLDALRGNGGLEHLMEVEGGLLDAKFVGGMHQIAARLARELGEAVVLNAPARRISQDGERVTVTTDKGDFTGRFAIVAVPPGPAQRIEFQPHLPAARDGLQQRMPMGAIIKIAVAYGEPFWRAAGLSGQGATADDLLGIVMDDVRDGGPAVLLAFIEGARALEMSAAGKGARRTAVVAALTRMFGPRAAEPLGYEDNDWTLEPWTHGYVGAMGPGVMTRFGPALREPVGRLHWAGTETSVEWAGCIEGALLSGLRAAGEVSRRRNM